MKTMGIRMFAISLAVPVLLSACAPTSNRVSLFNGKDLAGWDVLNCEAKVEDGAILLVDGNGLIQSQKQYSDFMLEYDWKALADDNWDSGVYFRYMDVPAGRPWPARYQANLLKGQEGNVNSIKGAASTGLIKEGDWNHFVLTALGEEVSLKINGQEAWKGVGLAEKSGYIAIQAEVPKGGQFLFRNIYITELGAE